MNPFPQLYTCFIESLIPFDDTVIQNIFFPFNLKIVTSGSIKGGKHIRIKYKLLYADNRKEVPMKYIFETNHYILNIDICHYDGQTVKIFSINIPGVIVNDDSTIKEFDGNWTKCFLDTNQNKMLGYMKTVHEITESYKIFNRVKSEMMQSSGFFSKMILGIKELIFTPKNNNNSNNNNDNNDDEFDEDAQPI